MCQYLITLAASNDYRQITRCEHGTIHFNWDWVTIYVDEETFAALVQLLRQGEQMSPAEHKHSKDCRLFYREWGYYQVWIRNVAINLSRIDFTIFANMAGVAWAELRQDSGEPAGGGLPHHAGQLQRTVEAAVLNRFSINL